MEKYLPLFIATLVGFLIGIEREKAQSPRSPVKMGVRSFVLVALLGALAGWIEQAWVGIVAALFALALILISRLSPTAKKSGNGSASLITEVTAAIVFCLGYAANQDPIGVAFLGPLVALILIMKERLHRLIGQIRMEELEAAIVLFLIGTGVIGLLADKPVDPWGLFNPRKFGLLVLVLAALEFSSYLTMKFLSEKRGALVMGTLGGLVSSTAVFFSTARESRTQPLAWRRQIISAISAAMASYGEMLFIVFVVAMPLSLRMFASVGLACLVGIGATALRIWKVEKTAEAKHAPVTIRSPLQLRGILRLAVLLALILMLVGATQRTFGDRGTQVLAFLTGLFELHGYSLATATLYAQGQLSQTLAAQSLEIAAFGSIISKIGIAIFLGRGKYARNLLWILLLMLAVLVGVNLGMQFSS